MLVRGNPNGARSVISDYEVFSRCQYMVPGKKFEFFVENDRTFFKINASTITVNITAITASNVRSQYTIVHNLDIYKQLLHPVIQQTN